MMDVFISDAPLPEEPLWLVERWPWREDLLHACMEEYTAPGELLWDPFAHHPALLRVAQATGRRVLATNFDPLPLLRLRLTLAPPAPRALDGIFSRLADTPRAGQPLFRHLDDLYRVHCPACQRPLSADYLIWEEKKPVEKGFRCPHCQKEGSAAITPLDLETLTQVEEKGAMYWRLCQRLAGPEDVELKQAKELLDLYTPRNRYALGELILLAESLFALDEPALEVVRGLCLACLQRCHSLHSDPAQRHLPRSLRRPSRFVERNVWRTFEAAYRQLRGLPRAPPITWAADLSALLETSPGRDGGQALTLQRTIRELGVALGSHSPFAFICTDPPRPQPAAHRLAFLWTGWLWGRKATLPLRPLLRRPSVDWEWYTEAMTTVFQTLRGLLAEGGRLLLAFTSEQRRLLPALLLAAARAELVLESGVFQVQEETTRGERVAYRLLFRRRSRPLYLRPPLSARDGEAIEGLATRLRTEGVSAAQAALRTRGEPASTAWLRASIYLHWGREGLLRAVPQRRWPFAPLAWLTRQLKAVLPPEGPEPDGLRRLAPVTEPGDKRPPHAGWWLAEPSGIAEPLSERVERAVIELLGEAIAWPEIELYDRVCRLFPGLLTPGRPLLEACIRSYAQEPTPGYWQLRPEDWPQARAEAHRQMVRLLVRLGRRLGFGVWLAPAEWERLQGAEGTKVAMPSGATALRRELDWAPCVLIWHEKGTPIHAFALSDTATLSPWLEPPAPALMEVDRYIVVPGGRSGLLAFKLRCYPEWRRRLAAHGWMIVKYRHLRRLAEMEDLDRAGWRARIGLDPIVERLEEQLPLFSTQTSSEFLDWEGLL